VKPEQENDKIEAPGRLHTWHAGTTSEQNEILGVVVERIQSRVVAKRLFQTPKTTRDASVNVASRQTRDNQQVSSLQLSNTIYITRLLDVLLFSRLFAYHTDVYIRVDIIRGVYPQQPRRYSPNFPLLPNFPFPLFPPLPLVLPFPPLHPPLPRSGPLETS